MQRRIVFLLALCCCVFFTFVTVSTVSASRCVPWCPEDTPGYEGVTGAAKRAKELQEHYGRILKKNTDAGVKELVKAWHKAYKGAIPDATLRKIVNENTLRIVGTYYGGLTGAAAGDALTRLYQDWEISVRNVKKAREENFPQWKTDKVAELGVALQVKDSEASYNHKDGARPYHEKIKKQYEIYHNKIVASSSEQEAQSFVWDFEDNATKIIRGRM